MVKISILFEVCLCYVVTSFSRRIVRLEFLRATKLGFVDIQNFLNLSPLTSKWGRPTVGHVALMNLTKWNDKNHPIEFEEFIDFCFLRQSHLQGTSNRAY